MPASSLGDLYLPPGPGIPRGLVIPAADLHEQFSRSTGPGGQGVNTTDSRVELVFVASDCLALSEAARARIGTVRVVAHAHRSQHRNRLDARSKLLRLLAEAVAPPPPPRVPTKPSKASRRRRVEAKVRRGEIKRLRGRVTD